MTTNVFYGFLLRIMAKATQPKANSRRTARASIVNGFAIFLLGATLYLFLYDILLDSILEWQIQLKEGGFLFKAWKDVPFPLRIRVHVFQLENGARFQEGLELPKVTDVGPFYFHEYRNRDILGWTENQGVVRFNERLKFNFDESQSVSPLSRRVKVINTPLLLILGFIDAKVNQFYLSMFSPVVSNVIWIVFRYFDEKLVEDRTVGEILTGRSLGILRIVDALSRPLRSLGIDVPTIGVGFYQLTESTFGFIHLRNNQTFGPAALYTGQTNAGAFNTFHSLNDKRLLPYYKHRSCNKLKGTDGTFFGAKPQRNKSIHIFNSHLCRPVRLDFVGDSNVGVIKTYRYLMDRYQYSIKHRPENWCFCPEDLDARRCEGVLYMKQCLGGAPLTITNVHFLHTPHLRRKVHGLKPVEEKHLGYLEMEPTLGASIDVGLRVQLNLDLKPYQMVSSLSHYKPVIMPYLWIEEGAAIQGHLKYLLMIGSLFFTYSTTIWVFMASLGTLMIIGGVVRLFKKQPKSIDTDSVTVKSGKNRINGLESGFKPPVSSKPNNRIYVQQPKVEPVYVQGKTRSINSAIS